MRRLLFVGTVAALMPLCGGVAGAQALPGVAELRARALESYQKSSAARERYICKELIRNDELNGNGEVKKSYLDEREIFYVNGFQISQEVSKNGRALNEGEIRKRDENVRKQIEAASDHKRPKTQGLVISAGDVLRLAKLDHERRVMVAGRPTIVFDVVPDDDAKASTVEEKLVAAMAGTVSIDEATGNLQDVNTTGAKDVKVGGGLVANVHKGFAMHILVAPEPDGVWLLKLAEGTGEARIGLVTKSAMRFHQETEGCKLYDVDATQVDKKK
ncbi:hypothetical protein [Granulicella tundricola]|uniref:Uncharacterized protein n=1 Tax=Granulicella tundricola (strain ATCC BAA-1859 / DSM 23138 / MP5ACTX9) TaxID=1198114 RepID=E8X433_GRATM|nr:hypothetical protein [Granulicella tundricola]ADW67093.1 hypothetical protein AciX9_0002 [Granulicella tundricola MP5ACTX9]